MKDPIGLRCAHDCCTDCYRDYLTKAIIAKNGSVWIPCPVENCGEIVDGKFTMQVITDTNVRQKLMVNSFVQVSSVVESFHITNYQRNRNMMNGVIYFPFEFRIFKHTDWLRWCPAPDCAFAIQWLKLSNTQNCKCACGKRFCYDCEGECHDPLPCELISKWEKVDYEAALHSTWNAEKCPNCIVPIGKDGGNHYMVSNCSLFSFHYAAAQTSNDYAEIEIHFQICHACKYEFCWICFGEWDNFNVEVHNYCDSDGRTQNVTG